eukprot:10531855-Alexandrium_andersonii.AAC.1
MAHGAVLSVTVVVALGTVAVAVALLPSSVLWWCKPLVSSIVSVILLVLMLLVIVFVIVPVLSSVLR